AAIHAVGGLLSLLPLMLPEVGEMFTLCFVVMSLVLVNIVHLVLTRLNPPHEKIDPRLPRTRSTPLL
ncbi:MAG: hypothetical protein SGPRY_002794, partial [Prymnesium sp.]